MSFTQQEKTNLNKYGINKSKSEANKLTTMGRAEGLRHFLTKAIIFWHLVMENHEVYSEVKTKSNKKIDLIDLTKRTMIEIETNKCLNKIQKNEKKLTWNWNNLIQVDSINITPSFNREIEKVLKDIELLL